MASDDPLADLDHDERAALAELAQARANGDLSRRDLMEAGGALGVGALLGGGGAAALTGSAAADASTSDGDQDINTPSDRGDAWFDGVDANVIDVGSLVIGGTLFEEDGNSPLNVSGQTSTTYTLASSSDHVIIIPDTSDKDFGFNELRCNGDTGSNYNYIDNGDNRTNGASEWSVPRFYRASWYELSVLGNSEVELGVLLEGSATGRTVAGDNSSIGGPITQFTFKDAGNTARDAKARIYRRVMNV